MQKSTLEIPFRRVRQANLRIDTLCKSVMNAGLISVKTCRRAEYARRPVAGSEPYRDRPNHLPPQIYQEDKTEMGKPDGVKCVIPRENIAMGPSGLLRLVNLEDVDGGAMYRDMSKIMKAERLADRITEKSPWAKDLVDGLMLSDI